GEVGEAQRRLDVAGAVAPEPRERVEAVFREEPPAVGRHHVDGGDDVFEDRLGDEVVEGDARPARLDPLAAAAYDPPVLVRALEADSEQAMPVRPRARAAATRLDPEEIVEQSDDVVVVEVAAGRRADDERDDREPVGLEVPEDVDVLVLPPPLDGAAPEV